MTERVPDARWLTDALATRDLDRLQPNMGAAGYRINEARPHIASALALAADDPTLAIAACHDAIRKAISAHMAAAGLRARTGEGAHRIVLDYARHQRADVIAEQLLLDADLIRRDRADAEYGDFAVKKFDASHIRWAASVAELIVRAVAAHLAA